MSKLGKIKKHLKEDGVRSTVGWLYNCLKFRLVVQKKNQQLEYKTLFLSKDEEKYVVPKKGMTVYIIASIPYYDIGGGQRCSQLAKTFNKMGFNVRYLYAFKSSESTIFNLSMPMNMHLLIDEETVDLIKNDVTENDLFIFEAPSVKFNGLLDLAIEKKSKIIYENIDNWETSLGSLVYNEDMLIKMLNNADLLVGTAKPLVEQLKNYLKKYKVKDKQVVYLPNAVDDELFCGLKQLEKPDDLVTDKKTFLYYGTLWGEWFDWDLIIDLANKYPRYSFNLIGDYKAIANKKSICPHNIHFLGLKKQIELPAYLKYVDYTILPFKPGEIGDSVSPLKIFEYISMYTRVLSTKLPDIQGYPNVFCGDTVEEWDKFILDDCEVDKEAADSFVEDNSWCSRISEMLSNVYPKFNESMLKDKLSIIILNYNNKNVIFKSVNSLLKFNDLYNYEIIVVDNGSKDGSYELLKKHYKNKITLIQNTKNGCSSGRNLGVSKATKEYIMFLDSDQWATNKYWLAPYEMILKNVKNVGLIGWAAGFFNSKGAAYHVVDNFPHRYMPPMGLCRNDIGYLGSGGMLMKKSDFDAVEGFDLAYDPTCYEDTDISLKIRNTGKEIYYCPYLGIIHLPHQTTKSGSDEHTKLIKSKQEYFTAKWMEKNKDLLKYKK